MSDPPMFNPSPRVSAVSLGDGATCLVIDDVLTDPAAFAAWAARGTYEPTELYPYPGVVAGLPARVTALAVQHFDRLVRPRLGARRTTDANLRLSIISTPPEALRPIQWQCHRDRIAADPARTLFAASVLYLFKDPALGGTSFYRSRLSPAQTDRLVADSQRLSAADYTERYGLTAGYMSGSNAYFERIASVPAAWNRMICYDGGLFHSADVNTSQPLSADPTVGRLTLNGFFTCTRPLLA
jgi:Family of unknown function (DUF6445)